MGCDIHPKVHVQIDGQWTELDPPEWWETPEYYREPKWVYGRNYDLFGVLAGVRRHRFPRVAKEWRGMPDDMAEKDDGYYTDLAIFHSQTWLTLDELLAYDWDVTDACGRTAREECAPFTETTLPGLQRLANEMGVEPSNLRLFVAFDS